jgi:thymidylate kinase
MRSGPWSLVQLRGAPLGAEDVNGDDVDLLASREAVDALLDAAWGWVREGWCHLEVEARRPGKVEMTLVSTDGRHRVLIDLWLELWQLNRGRQRLRYSDCKDLLAGDGSIRRLPLDVEVCVYLHHLACKRKDLGNDRVRDRVARYREACEDSGEGTLLKILDRIADEGTLAEEGERKAMRRLCQRLGIEAEAESGARPGRLARTLRSWLLAAPRKTTLVTLMGCDGSGKTSLGRRLCEDLPEVGRLFTGKHLYRKSITYKLAVIFLRPLTFQSREKFDELIAPLVYLRACLGLEIRRWRTGESVTLLDRSLVDFLYVDRKTDQPRFSRLAWLARFVGRRIPTVHCVLPYEEVVKRKDEMTEAGHARYDGDMFEHFTRRVPTSYVAFNNDRSLDDAAEVLGRMLRCRLGGND